MILAATDTTWIIPIAISILLFIAGTPLVRRQRKKATVELEESTLALAQREIDVERSARLAAEARCTERIEAQDRRHARELADHREQNAAKLGQLEGQVSVLTEQFAGTIADAVLKRIDARGD